MEDNVQFFYVNMIPKTVKMEGDSDLYLHEWDSRRDRYNFLASLFFDYSANILIP